MELFCCINYFRRREHFLKLGFYGSKYFHEIKILKCRVLIREQARTEALMWTLFKPNFKELFDPFTHHSF